MTTLRKPPRLRPGMTIGVIAPSSALRDERLERGIARIEARGYRVRRGDHLYTRHGYHAATDAMRAADLTAMFADPEVDAVFCARGGYGAWRIVDRIDWDVVAANPKLFVGYSDITTLHLAMERRAGLVTIHGPVVTTLGADMATDCEECFWRVLEEVEPFGCYCVCGREPAPLVPGKAVGRLAGGCLSLLAASAGTPDAPSFRHRIVLIEDVHETVPHVDRHLSQLLRAGAFEGAAGIVVGTVTGWDKDLEKPATISLDDVWRDRLAPLGIPTMVGFPFGHEPNPLTLPLGCLAELDADRSHLTLLESAVC
jgi:muramoyltetrapeptide carboxypeptidase